jgi:serine/threonine-protein kinase HipA
MIESLDVILWGTKVGKLVSTHSGYNTQICFYFDADFVKRGYDIAPLRAPLSGPVAQRGLPVYPEKDKLFGGLPSFIADSMPDHWGNIVLREWAKEHHIHAKDLSPLDRLAYIGRRGMGALEFVPPTAADLELPFKIEVSELSVLAQKVLAEAKGFHAVLNRDFAIESLFKVGTSAGGRRPKAVVNVDLSTGECSSGQVAEIQPGSVAMIIKFDEHSAIPTTNIEYSYYLMALDAGMNMMPSRLLQCNGETHFLTDRFDRVGGQKIHVQTLAAMNPLADSYEDLLNVATMIGVTPCEMQQLFRQMVMNVLGGNIDDHSKNFSFMMAKDGIWHVAPAYDYTFTVDTDAPSYINRHSIAINGSRQQITMNDLLAVATRFNIKGATAVIAKSMETVANYRKFAIDAGVPEPWIVKIEQEIATRLASL